MKAMRETAVLPDGGRVRLSPAPRTSSDSDWRRMQSASWARGLIAGRLASGATCAWNGPVPTWMAAWLAGW